MFALFGIVLVIAGAILAFAVDRTAEGIDLEVAGWILMAGGGLSLLVAAITGAMKQSRITQAARIEQESPAAGHVVSEEVTVR